MFFCELRRFNYVRCNYVRFQFYSHEQGHLQIKLYRYRKLLNLKKELQWKHQLLDILLF